MKNKILSSILSVFFFAASAQAATFVVNSIGDGADANTADNSCQTATVGECTLRAAIEQANQTAGADTINFNVAGAGVKTVAPLTSLPFIAQTVTIDGYTQPAASVNTSVTTDNAVILIELSGANAGANVDGLRLAASGSGSTIRGLAINRFTRTGISLDGSDNNIISGNFIGTDATGLIDLGNTLSGVNGEFGSNANSNLIGGTTPAARNIISGNGQSGIEFGFALGNVIQGNFVGLGSDGATAVGNSNAGLDINSFVSGFLVGGDDAADGAMDGVVNARNYISGNAQTGIFFGGAGASGASIQGNFIGTDTTGTIARPNRSGISTNLARVSTIGGTTAGAGNLISGNTLAGISLANTGPVTVVGNRIGTRVGGITALGNGGNGVEIVVGGAGNVIGGTGANEGNIIAFNSGGGVYVDSFLAPNANPILGNSIFSNGLLGIDLGFDGVTTNDLDDVDTGGGNNRQNFPVLSAVTTAGAATTVQGSLNSIPNTNFRVEVFVSSSCDPSYHGEGRTLVGAGNTTTDAGGDSPVFSLAIGATPTSNVFTATATQLDAMLVPVETSEFSMCAQEPDAPLTFVVNSNADDDDGNCNDAPGDCTLREAINRANVNVSTDWITFNIAPGGAQTIAVGAGGLPVIMNRVSIDGTTQPGFSGSPPIELNGAGAGTGTDGLRITAGSTVVKGFVINRFDGDGIEIAANGGNIVTGNYIGTDAAGAGDAGNAGRGIFVNGAVGNRIGGTTTSERNVISGNETRGIEFSNGTTGNFVQGNYIGTNAAGTAGVANFGGILTNTGTHTVGGTAAAARNIISANNSDGIVIRNVFGTSSGTIVQGNYVGTNAAGTAALGNGNAGILIFNEAHFIGGAAAGAGNGVSGNGAVGIIFIDTSGSTAQGNFVGTNAAGTAAVPNGGVGIEIRNALNNLIGGTNAGEGNTIAFNGFIGVYVRSGTGNRILSNSIFSNGGLGIDLETIGVTANDAGDADAGANNQQNFPVIAFAQAAASTRVVGTFNSTANQTFRLEFFSTPTADASGNGEGQTFVGSINVTTNGGGNSDFDQVFPATAAIGNFVSATATNLTTNDTSEFSNAAEVFGPSAATVSIGGRVLNQTGRGVFGAQVQMTDASGNARYATTNAFGYYRFAEVAAGEVYFFTASYRRARFAARVVSVNEDLNDLNFVALSQPPPENNF